MSIRYECDQCGSVLKIKDDLAGKPGKCPKCKTAFTVPDLAEESPASDEVSLGDLDEGENPPPSSGEFDVDAFLSNDDDSGAKAKSKVAKTSRPSKKNEPDQAFDNSEKKSKTKKSTSDGDDEDSFQIRRGPDVPAKSKAAFMPGLDDDDAAEEPPPSSRRPPGTNPNAGASNIASDLLSKSSKKGKKASWEEPQPEKKEAPSFDWESLRYEAKTKLAPIAAGAVVLYAVVYFLVFPMFAGKSYEPKLGRVTGTVTVGGKPLAAALVWFHPDHKTEEFRGKAYKVTASVGQTDAAGHYELRYDPQRKGAIVGKHRIQIEATDYTGIADQYFDRSVRNLSTATREVKAGSQVIDLDLSK